MTNSFHKSFVLSGVFLSSCLAVLLLGGALSSGVRAAGPASGSGERLLTIHDGSEDRGILTRAATLRQAFKEAGISIDPNDLVEPGLDEALIASSYDINIYRARPVTVIDGAVRKRIMSAYRTPRQIVVQAGIALQDEDLTATAMPDDFAGEGAAIQLTITRASSFTFVRYGKQTTAYTQAKTVGDMLKAKKITLGDDDTLSVSSTDPIKAGMTIELWREGKQTVTTEEEVAFDVEKIQDMDREIGFREVRTPGVPGKRTVTYEVEMKNGAEVSRKAIQSITTKEPVRQVETVGAKNNYGGSLNEWLKALRTCETGGNYARNSGNGYYGAYQFLPSTWNSIAGKTGRSDLIGVRPDLASQADQDAMVIANTNMTAGLVTQHPGCYAKLGISNKPPAN